MTWFSFANGRYSFWTNLWMFVAAYTLFKPKMANIYLIHDPSSESNAFMNNKYHTNMLFILLISLNATTKSGLRSRIMQFAGCSIASANFWNPEHGNSLLRVFYSVFSKLEKLPEFQILPIIKLSMVNSTVLCPSFLSFFNPCLIIDVDGRGTIRHRV